MCYLIDQVKKFVADSMLQSYQVFAMTSATKDLDVKLDNALSSMTLDTEGKLVQPLSLRGAFKVFEPTFNLFLSEWMENCNVFGRCKYSSLGVRRCSCSDFVFVLLFAVNWGLYSQVVQVSITLLNAMERSVRSLLELEGLGDPLPDFNAATQLDDSECVCVLILFINSTDVCTS